VAHGIVLPTAANTWTRSADVGDRDEALLVARLGTSEFFLEDGLRGTTLRGIARALEARPSGVYPVLREDAAFLLSGEGTTEVLAQVCNVNFAELRMDSRPLIMTLMIGVAVLVVPEGADAESRYRIWCDPTFGSYLEHALETVVVECGGRSRGVTA
jgi:sarcosine oxidase, subunit gamma